MLELSKEFKSVIKPNSDLQSLRAQTAKEGMVSLRDSGAKKVSEGFTTIQEVLRVTPFDN